MHPFIHLPKANQYSYYVVYINIHNYFMLQ